VSSSLGTDSFSHLFHVGAWYVLIERAAFSLWSHFAFYILFLRKVVEFHEWFRGKNPMAVRDPIFSGEVPMAGKGGILKTENYPHTYTYSFLVLACIYYLNHYYYAPTDSIYTIDIPPRVRNVHNHFLYAIPFKLLLFIYLSRFFGEIR